MSSSEVYAADDVMLLDIFTRYQRSEKFQYQVIPGIFGCGTERLWVRFAGMLLLVHKGT